MNKLIPLILVFLLMCPHPAFSEKTNSPVLVTASRIETPMDQIGKSATVIDSAQIEQNKNSFLGNLLETTPSLRVRQNGGPGTFSPIQIRGSTPSQVLVLINGFPVLDASNFGGDASDLIQNFYMDDVERIEIVRGPLSTLYGADALGGTINIITKKGAAEPSGNIYFEGGTKNTFRESGTLQASYENIDYAFTVIRNDSDGLDSHDVFNATTLSTTLGTKLADNVSVNNFLRYTRSRVNFDELGSPPLFLEVDDPTRLQESDFFVWGTEIAHQINDLWEQKLRYSYNNVDSGITDKIDPADMPVPGLLLRTRSEGITHNVELLENFYGLENHILTLGLEYERQEAETSTRLFGIPPGKLNRHVDNKAVFIQDQLTLFEKLFFTSGLRVDHFASFGTTVNYAFSLAYLLKELGTKIKANFGTAFNDPSLTQLFDPVIGNPGLEPEEVIGFDFGLEQKLFDEKIWLSATFFRQDYEELITISRVVTPAGIFRRAINSGKALAQGLELESRLRLIENVDIGVNYTLTDSELEAPNTRIPEIPDAQVSVFADCRLWEKIRVHLNIDFVDDSLIAPIPGFPKNEARTTVDMAVNYDVCPGFSVFGRIENLFNEKYKDDTLEAPGFFAFGGMIVSF